MIVFLNLKFVFVLFGVNLMWILLYWLWLLDWWENLFWICVDDLNVLWYEIIGVFMLYLMLNFFFIWFIKMFKWSLFILLMIICLVFLLVCVWNVGFFFCNLIKVWVILFWLVLDFGFIDKWIIGFGNFIDFKIMLFFLLYKVLLVFVFLRFIVVVIFLEYIVLIFWCELVCICNKWFICLCLFLVEFLMYELDVIVFEYIWKNVNLLI